VVRSNVTHSLSFDFNLELVIIGLVALATDVLAALLVFSESFILWHGTPRPTSYAIRVSWIDNVLNALSNFLTAERRQRLRIMVALLLTPALLSTLKSYSLLYDLPATIASSFDDESIQSTSTKTIEEQPERTISHQSLVEVIQWTNSHPVPKVATARTPSRRSVLLRSIVLIYSVAFDCQAKPKRIKARMLQ
jgi:hypothetical protein